MLVVYALTRLNQNVDHMQYLFSAAVSKISQVLIGKQRQVELAVTGLLANGHLRIEDVPGVGKNLPGGSYVEAGDKVSPRDTATIIPSGPPRCRDDVRW